MSNVFVILLMLFFHIIDDYHLQGILAEMKQRNWWWDHAPQQMYKYDYIMALAMHSLSWSFMIMLPIALVADLNVSLEFAFVFMVNAVLHGLIDNLKANKRKISLVTDQSLHLLQIAVTAIIFIQFGI